MARLIPFSYSFSTTDGSQGSQEYKLTASKLKSLTIEVETDNVGVILVSASITVEGKKHQLGQPTGIYDGDGYNARLFDWSGIKPLSRYQVNILTINWSNYSGDNAIIRFTGVVEK